MITLVMHPIVEHALATLRDERTAPAAFREAAAQVALALLLEATRDLATAAVTVKTPLQETSGRRLTGRLGIVPILRAGLGFMESALTLLPDAEIWHLGIFRNEETLEPVTYYNKLDRAQPPETCIVVDPMLATGGSATATLEVLTRWGVPRLKYVCIIAAPEGIAAVERQFPAVAIYTAAVDERLNDIGYILPGLGDAGDRLFNTLP